MALASALPLLLAFQQTIIVDNSASDDTAALLNALAMVNTGPTVIEFKGGDYDFFVTHTPVRFELADKADITLTGSTHLNPTTLKFHNFDPNAVPATPGAYRAPVFHFDRIQGLTISNLKVRLTREPYSTGIVKLVDSTNHFLELEMEEVYPDLQDGFQVQNVNEFDPVARRLTNRFFHVGIPFSASNPQYVTTVLPGSPQRVRFEATDDATPFLIDQIDNVQVGTALVMMHDRRSTIFGTYSCSDVVLRNVYIRDGGGSGLWSRNCNNITVDNLDIQPKPDRLLSITADAVHIQDCTGQLVMVNCNLSRMGDDGLNTHSQFLEVTGVPGTPNGTVGLRFLSQVSTPPPSEILWAPGDTIEFYAPNFQKKGSAVLVDFQYFPFRATFDSGIPLDLSSGDLAANRNRLPASVLVEDCVIEGNLARGLTLHGQNITVRDCVFRQNTGPAIEIECDGIQFFESSPADNILIAGCVIDDSNRYAGRKLGAISISGQHQVGVAGPPPPPCSDPKADPKVAGPGLHRNITLSGNSFINLGNDTLPFRERAGIWIASADAVALNSNTFSMMQFDANDETQNLVRFEKATNVISDGLNCAGSFAGTWFTVICSTFVPPPPVACDW